VVTRELRIVPETAVVRREPTQDELVVHVDRSAGRVAADHLEQKRGIAGLEVTGHRREKPIGLRRRRGRRDGRTGVERTRLFGPFLSIAAT